MNPKKISVILATYNRLEILRKVLQSLSEQILINIDDFEVLIGDDGSNDGTREFLLEFAESAPFDCKCFFPERLGGAARARNHCVAAATGELLVFIGDDTWLSPAFLFSHLSEHEQGAEPGWAVLGFTQWCPDLPVNTVMQHIDGVGAQQFSYHYLNNGQEVDWRHFYTSNISLNRKWFAATNLGFSESLEAFEDAALAFQLKSFGLRIRYSVRPLAYHHHPHTVWSFSKRQLHIGRCGAKLVALQPGIAPHLSFHDVMAPNPDTLRVVRERIKRDTTSDPYQELADEIKEKEWQELWKIFEGQNINAYVMLTDRLSQEEKREKDHWNEWFDGTGMRAWWD